MIRRVFAGAAALFLMAPGIAPAAVAGDDALSQLVEQATQAFTDNGFTATGWVYQNTLKQGGEETTTVTLDGGTLYGVMGVCDSDCGDLDIHLIDSSGNEVAKDLDADDFPIVRTESSGTYTLRVVMVACSTEPCGYVLKAFRK